MNLKHTIVSIVAAGFLVACGSNDNKNNNSSNTPPEKVIPPKEDIKKDKLTDITVERGPIYGATVKDSSSPSQTASSKGNNSNIYTFTKEITYPIIVTGGFIDINNDKIINSADAKLTTTLSSYSDVVNPITTYLGNPKDKEQYKEKMDILKGVSTNIKETEIENATKSSILTDINIFKLASSLYVNQSKEEEITSANLKKSFEEFKDDDNINTIETKALKTAKVPTLASSNIEILNEERRLNSLDLKVTDTNLSEFYNSVVSKDSAKNLTQENIKPMTDKFPEILSEDKTITKTYSIEKSLSKDSSTGILKVKVSLSDNKAKLNSTANFEIKGFDITKTEKKALSMTPLMAKSIIINEFEYSAKELSDKLNKDLKNKNLKNAELKEALKPYVYSSKLLTDEDLAAYDFEFVKADFEDTLKQEFKTSTVKVTLKLTNKNDKTQTAMGDLVLTKLSPQTIVDKYRPAAKERQRLQKIIGSDIVKVSGSSTAEAIEFYKAFNELTGTDGSVAEYAQIDVLDSKREMLKSLMPKDKHNIYFPSEFKNNGADYKYKVSYNGDGIYVYITMSYKGEENSVQTLQTPFLIKAGSFKTENLEETVKGVLELVNKDIIKTPIVTATSGSTAKKFIDTDGPEITFDETNWMDVDSYMEYMFKDGTVPPEYSALIKDGYDYPNVKNGVKYEYKLKYNKEANTLSAKIVLKKAGVTKESNEFTINGFAAAQ